MGDIKTKIETFGQELIQASGAYLYKPAIYHHFVAGDCIALPRENCPEIGIGPDEFDCSGFVIKSICDVKGLRPSDWPDQVRHVRDMWNDAQTEQVMFKQSALEAGALLITQKYYDIGDQQTEMPGHMGIVLTVEDETVRYIHASAKRGRVEICKRRIPTSYMGAIVSLS
ncbi:MAG: NlpC/P60 family protein [Candidatus Saccharibacteria bacterium]|nr:NlpC/P60 family protein [Candidatus Saccharibacteria bacterium]